MKFTKLSSNPIYGKDLGTVFDVYVTKDKGLYRMDFSWRPEKALAVAFSEDGVNWSKPQITLRNDLTTGFEDDVNRNCVLHRDGKYQMWYTGQSLDHRYSYIGYAESEDGIEFHRFGAEPVLWSERPYEGQSVMNPCVLFENGLYRMWYATGETYEPNVLAYAESRDGIHWTKRRANPMFVADATRPWECARVGGCQVLPHKELGYLMFYIGYKDINTACVCCAASKDGVTGFRRCKDNPLAAPDADGWDADSCYKPSALFDDGKWKIWYNGRREHVELVGGAEAVGDFTEADFAD